METSLLPVLVAKPWKHKGLNPSSRKFCNKSQPLAPVAAGVCTNAQAVLAKVPVLTWQEAEGLCAWWVMLRAHLPAQSYPPPPPHTHMQSKLPLSCAILESSILSSPAPVSAGLTLLLPQVPTTSISSSLFPSHPTGPCEQATGPSTTSLTVGR